MIGKNRINSSKYLFAIIIILLSFSAKADVTDREIDFLEGEVSIVDFTDYETRFRIIENGALVDVRNDIHIRLVDNPFPPPKQFKIIAPMTAVDLVDGEIPTSYIHRHSLKHYLMLRKQYHGE